MKKKTFSLQWIYQNIVYFRKITFFRFIIPVLAVITVVIHHGLVIISFTITILVQPVVLVTEQPVILQGERVPRYELLLAGHTTKALQVKYPVFGAHHVVVFAELAAAFITLGAEQADIVLLAVGLAVTHKTGTFLVQKHLALVALEIKINCLSHRITDNFPEKIK